jgi:hypothetical protein
VGFLGGVILGVWQRSWGWAVGGILLGSVIPFTLVFVMPTNRLLIDIRAPLKDDVARALLEKWGWMHAVRTALSMLGFLLLLHLLLHS